QPIGHGHRSGPGTDQYDGRHQRALQGHQLGRSVPMRSHDPRGRRLRTRTPRRPILEGLEAREMPSSVAAATAGIRPGPRPASAIVARPDSSSGLIGKRAPGPFLNQAVLRRVAAALYRPGVPPGTPTPREIRRQTFTARWVGQYTIGAPRFEDRASTIHLYGV